MEASTTRNEHYQRTCKMTECLAMYKEIVTCPYYVGDTVVFAAVLHNVLADGFDVVVSAFHDGSASDSLSISEGAADARSFFVKSF